MDKQKQIEEMASLIYDNRPIKDIWNEEAEDIAKTLYNAGYRKIDENAVVLEKTEYDKLRILADECLDWRRKYCNVGELPKENAVVLTKEEYEQLKNNQMPLHPIVLTVKQYTDLKLEAVLARKETAEKFAERLKELEEALLDMVVQFCQMGEEGKLKHIFMSAEEQAFDVLDITYGENVDEVYERFYKKWDRPIYEIAKEIIGERE